MQGELKLHYPSVLEEEEIKILKDAKVFNKLLSIKYISRPVLITRHLYIVALISRVLFYRNTFDFTN